MIGELGVCGDGVDQNDFVTFGIAGFEPPANIRHDKIFHSQRQTAVLEVPDEPGAVIARLAHGLEASAKQRFARI